MCGAKIESGFGARSVLQLHFELVLTTLLQNFPRTDPNPVPYARQVEIWQKSKENQGFPAEFD
jgi:hypothetical protein